jgi:type IV pilus assembly protein PilM
MQPLVPQTIVDGAIMDQAAVVEAIRALWSRLKLRQKDVAIAIAGHSVIIKKIAVPQTRADDLDNQIRQEAEHHIPFAKDDVEIDYHVVNPQNPMGQTELLLVAAKRETVADYVQVVRDASLTPQVVDVASFASQNGFEANYTLDPRETAVIITIGAAISNINIVRGGARLFTRDVTIGGNAFTEEIQKQLGVSADEAEAYKVGGSYDEHGVVPQEVERIIEGVAEVIAGEFQRSLDFFMATTADANVTRVCLAGGTAKVAALHRAIERRSRLTVEVIDAGSGSRSTPASIAATSRRTRPRRWSGWAWRCARRETSEVVAMIKINLLPQRKPKKQAEPGQLEVGLVMAGMLAAAAAGVLRRPPAAQARSAIACKAEARELSETERSARARRSPTCRLQGRGRRREEAQGVDRQPGRDDGPARQRAARAVADPHQRRADDVAVDDAEA